MATEFVVLEAFPQYEIEKDYPHRIRRIGKDKCIKVNKSQTYPRVTLNCENYKLHRVIAQQFIPNDDPVNKPLIDHIDRNKENYHLSNLRWVSHGENGFNKTSFKGYVYEFLEYENIDFDDMVAVDNFNDHEFEDVYYQPEQNRFLFDTGINFRVMPICYKPSGSAFVHARSTENEYISILLTKYKRENGFV